MSEHSEIVHSYIELRNFLASSHPRPNMPFEVGFVINEQSLLAFSSVSKSSIEVARIQPRFFLLYTPHSGLRFEAYSNSLIRFVNDGLEQTRNDPKTALERTIFFSLQHRKSLDLKTGYEPKI
jgi:hypothetical protein